MKCRKISLLTHLIAISLTVGCKSTEENPYCYAPEAAKQSPYCLGEVFLSNLAIISQHKDSTIPTPTEDTRESLVAYVTSSVVRLKRGAELLDRFCEEVRLVVSASDSGSVMSSKLVCDATSEYAEQDRALALKLENIESEMASQPSISQDIQQRAAAEIRAKQASEMLMLATAFVTHAMTESDTATGKTQIAMTKSQQQTLLSKANEIAPDLDGTQNIFAQCGYLLKQFLSQEWKTR